MAIIDSSNFTTVVYLIDQETQKRLKEWLPKAKQVDDHREVVCGSLLKKYVPINSLLSVAEQKKLKINGLTDVLGYFENNPSVLR